MQNSLRIGRLFGIPLEVHASWLLIFGLIVWSLGADYFPMHNPGTGVETTWAAAVATALLFFASVVAHELAHSLLARARGITVERITLFVLGGVSSLKTEASGPRTELAVAAVGPVVSLALGGVLWILWPSIMRANATAGVVAYYLAYGNVALGVFNLIPAFPLDGGRVLRGALWEIWHDFARATLAAIRVARVAAGGVVLVGIWLLVVADGVNGLWLMLIGWFLWSAATQERMRTLVDTRLRGHGIAPLVRFDFITLDADQTITQAADRILAAPPQAVYPVLGNGALVGVVNPACINATARELWTTTKMHWLARRTRPVPILDLGTDALDALAQMNASQLEGLPVSDDEAGVVALVERSAIERWISLATT